MMADNVEHVITYWLIYERFHSPALAGFAVVSHWAPFLLFGITFGALADRYDCRRIIQAGQFLFIIASFSWAILFLTDTLQPWHAAILLIVHGVAGAPSLLVGNAYQAQMPQFAGDIPGAQGEVGYGVLLTASAAGAVVGGFALEWSSWLRRPSVAPALAMGVAWAITIAVFAFTGSYVIAVLALFAAGFLNLGFSSLAQ